MIGSRKVETVETGAMIQIPEEFLEPALCGMQNLVRDLHNLGEKPETTILAVQACFQWNHLD